MRAATGFEWRPGFVAKRWRHVFWSLPLLGLAAGAVAYWGFGVGQATWIEQVDDELRGPQSGVDRGAREQVLGLLEEVRGAAYASEVLGVPRRELGRRVSLEVVDEVIRIEVRHPMAAEARRIAGYFERIGVDAAVRLQDERYEEERRRLMAEIDRLGDGPDGAGRRTRERWRRLVDQRVALDAGRRAFGSRGWIRCHAPAAGGTGILIEEVDSRVTLLAGGFSLGVLLTVPLAYLLEWLLPARPGEGP